MNIKEKLDQSNKIFFEIYNSKEYDSLKNIISDAKEVIFCGVGKNWYICEKIVKTWLSMGIRCQSLDCVHALHGDLGMLTSNNDKKVIFFLSKSGTTDELIKLVKTINMLKHNNIIDSSNITMVGFSLNKNMDGTLFDMCLCPTDYEYQDIQEFDQRNLVPSLSINTMQMVLDALGVEVYEKNPKLIENYKFNHLAGKNGQRLGGDNILKNL